MADDIRQRIMDAQADAEGGMNGLGSSRSDASFQHSKAFLQITGTGVRGADGEVTELTGDKLHAELLRRAKAKEEQIDEQLGADAIRLRRYDMSLLGSGYDRSNHTALMKERDKRSLRRMAERKKEREKSNQDRHQRFNAGDSGGQNDGGDNTRQGFNATPPDGPRFKEPPTRGYNPYG